MPARRRQAGVGDNVSHSHRRTRRRWSPGIRHRRSWLPAEGRAVRPALSAKAVKTVDRLGIEAAVVRNRDSTDGHLRGLITS
ncbi:bL28 family ribosomal protein [Streptosporangium roseum]|uniref:bL28 family ribosomal protein n=1 Tax=Streptosporangium roseum TaxID=2001 RepID=UPI00332EBCD6